jgi:hypothetical protein
MAFCAIGSGLGGLAEAGEAAAKEISAGEEAAVAAAPAGNNAIDIGSDAFVHVVEAHIEGGVDTEENSIFSGDSQDVANLIQNSQTSSGKVQARVIRLS